MLLARMANMLNDGSIIKYFTLIEEFLMFAFLNILEWLPILTVY